MWGSFTKNLDPPKDSTDKEASAAGAAGKEKGEERSTKNREVRVEPTASSAGELLVVGGLLRPTPTPHEGWSTGKGKEIEHASVDGRTGDGVAPT